MKVLFAAGGTGGHIFPAIAIAEALKSATKQVPSNNADNEIEIVFIGTGNQIEQKLISEQAGFKLIKGSSSAFKGKSFLRKLLFPFIATKLFVKNLKLLKNEKPNLVIGFGGYPAFFPVLSAYFLQIPTMIHEQNIQVGLANKILSRFTTMVFAVSGSKGFPKRKDARYLPNPVRAEFLRTAPWKRPAPSEEISILILGGSQGAKAFNNFVRDEIPFFKRLHDKYKLRIIHQTGSKEFFAIADQYSREQVDFIHPTIFIDDIFKVYESSHLIIARAGAMSVAEISAAGRPCIYIPLPISSGHQKDNIKLLLENNACFCVEQTASFHENLKTELEKLLENFEVLEETAKRAKSSSFANDTLSPADTIASEIFKLL